MVQTNQPRPCPASVSNIHVNLGAVVLFFISLILLNRYCAHLDSLILAVITLGVTALPVFIYDHFFLAAYRRPAAGLHLKPAEFCPARFFTKLAGLALTLTILVAVYYLLFLLTGSKVLAEFLRLLRMIGPWALGPALVYFYWVDRHQINGQDEYWQAGCLATGQWKKIQRPVLLDHIKIWLIKGFFTPYLFYFLMRYIEFWSTLNWRQFNPLMGYNVLLDMLYMIDILFGVLGYVFTCRWLDTHIRSTDPTWLGWLVCLICYGFFNTYFGIGLLNYDDGRDWNHWAGGNLVLFHALGLFIVVLTVIYSLATVAMGTRMSNLTYRGIITSGPYRFCKHPAYVTKVASWWLISLPFLSMQGPTMALKHTAALVFISFIYYLRAVTEENHLSNYPEYVDYARWINDHGILNPLAKLFPVLQYSPEKNKRWGSVLKSAQ